MDYVTHLLAVLKNLHRHTEKHALLSKLLYDETVWIADTFRKAGISKLDLSGDVVVTYDDGTSVSILGTQPAAEK
jgi:hypothetical protein